MQFGNKAKDPYCGGCRDFEGKEVWSRMAQVDEDVRFAGRVREGSELNSEYDIRD